MRSWLLLLLSLALPALAASQSLEYLEVRGSAVASNAIELSWEAPAHPVAYYLVKRDSEIIGKSLARSFVDAAADENKVHLYEVEAYGSQGQLVAFSLAIPLTAGEKLSGCAAYEKNCFDSVDNDCDSLVDFRDANECSVASHLLSVFALLGLGVLALVAWSVFSFKKSDYKSKMDLIHKPERKKETNSREE